MSLTGSLPFAISTIREIATGIMGTATNKRYNKVRISSVWDASVSKLVTLTPADDRNYDDVLSRDVDKDNHEFLEHE